MRIRFFTDPDGTPHIEQHGLDQRQVLEALSHPLERIRGRGDSIILIGRTRDGRTLRIIYAPARDGDGIIVITAYDLPPKQLKALNRRLRRRPRS